MLLFHHDCTLILVHHRSVFPLFSVSLALTMDIDYDSATFRCCFLPLSACCSLLPLLLLLNPLLVCCCIECILLQYHKVLLYFCFIIVIIDLDGLLPFLFILFFCCTEHSYLISVSMSLYFCVSWLYIPLV